MDNEKLKTYYWCAKEGEVVFTNCSQCQGKNDNCQYRFQYHSDAVWKADLIRVAQNRPLFSKDWYAMKASLQQKEILQKEIENPKIEINEEKRVKQNNIAKWNKDDLLSILFLIVVVVICSFPIAYLSAILQAFVSFLYSAIKIIFGIYEFSEFREPLENDFFYNTFWERYIYWLSMLLCGIGWLDFKKRSKGILLWYRIITTALFGAIAIIYFNLFITTIIGPLIIIFSIAYNARR